MPNFLLIGAAKGGTTSLHRYLRQHPDIFMSERKELRFFPFENQRPDYRGPGDQEDILTIVTQVEDYRLHFEGSENFSVRGESSPLYLYLPNSAERISHYVPDAKLIAILRQPAERAYSHYLMLKRDGFETLGFAEALAAEDQRVGEKWGHRWHYRRRGFYAAQLQRYFDQFPREQIRIYLYEDYVSDPIGLVQDVFRFLNVDDSFIPDMSVRHNESRIARSRALQVYLREPRATKNLLKPFIPRHFSRRLGDRLRDLNLTKPDFPEELRSKLNEIYRADIEKLQTMLGRDLSHWTHNPT